MTTIDNILGNGVPQQDKPAVIPPFASEIKGTGNYIPPASANNSETVQPTGGGVAPPPVATPTLTQQDSGGRKRSMTYVEMLDKMSPYKPPTEEELAKERKKQKRDSILAAIGDGLSAFHWAHSTAAGTKSMVDPRVSLTGRVRDRYDRIKKEREEQKAAYNSAYMKAVQMDEAYDDNDRKWQRQLGLDKMSAEKTAKEQERKDALAEAQRGKYEAATNKDEAMTAYWQAKTNAINEGLPLDLAVKKAEAAKKRAEAARGGSGGNRAPGEHPWYDADGNLHYAHSYEAARQNAQLNGTWEVGTQTSTSVKQKGRQKTTTTTTKSSKGRTKKPESAKSKFSIH